MSDVAVSEAALVRAICDGLAEIRGHPAPASTGPETNLWYLEGSSTFSLDLDSIELLEILLMVEEAHGIEFDPAAINFDAVETLGDLARELAATVETM